MKDATFQLAGTTYKLDKNNGKHCLHGGIRSFSHRFWKFNSFAPNSVEFELTTGDLDAGFPGKLKCYVNFTLTDCNQLIMDYRAELLVDHADPESHTKVTVINLTNHSYFNLDGFMAEKPTILDHMVTIDSSKYLERDDEDVFNGKILSINDHKALDFRKPKRIGDQIDDVGLGYDHCYVLNPYGCPIYGGPLREVAQVWSPQSGITMKVSTTEPSIQFYTANYLHPNIPTKSYPHLPDFKYDKHYGFCLEAQRFPNAMNIPEWNSQCILNGGQTYKQKTIYQFSNTK